MSSLISMTLLREDAISRFVSWNISPAELSVNEKAALATHSSLNGKKVVI